MEHWQVGTLTLVIINFKRLKIWMINRAKVFQKFPALYSETPKFDSVIDTGTGASSTQ